jgi:hypothetical protein
MSTGCAALFGGNIYGFIKFPLGGTTDFLGRFLKASLTPSMFTKTKKIGHCKNQNKSEKQQKLLCRQNGCNLQF